MNKIKDKLKKLLYVTIFPILSGCSAINAADQFGQGYSEMIRYYNDGIQEYTHNNKNKPFIDSVNDLFKDTYGIAMSLWTIVLLISMIALIYSIVKYGRSGENSQLRAQAQSDIMTCLIVIACVGAAPIMLSIIMTLMNAMS